jgi:beta-glucosidase
VDRKSITLEQEELIKQVFAGVSLKPGETKTVNLPLAAQSLAYFDEAKSKFVVLEEPLTLRIGSSSADILLEQKISVVAAN